MGSIKREKEEKMRFNYYKISNIINGEFYIGITKKDLDKRKKEHFNLLYNNKHYNDKLQNDFNKYGEEAFQIELIDTLDGTAEEGYQHEWELIQKYKATESYNILEGGRINPVYSPQVVERLRKTHQAKYTNVLQYKFVDNKFYLINKFGGVRDASRTGEHDFRAIQNCMKTAKTHHSYYWVPEDKKDEWFQTFLKRFTCCVAKINEETQEIEDTALTISEFAKKYNTTYSKIYSSIIQNNRCDRKRKLKFIRITSQEFAKINNLSL